MRRVASMVLLLAVLFVAANVGAADKVETRNGSLRVAQPAEEWQQTDVVVTPEAQKYPAEWQEAFRNPGTVVPVKTTVRLGAMRDLAHQQKDIIIELGVVMTGGVGEKIIDVVGGEGRVAKSETIYNPYAFFWWAAMLLMTLACWLMRYGKSVAPPAAAFAFAFAFAFAAAAFAFAAVAVAVAAAFAATVAAAVVENEEDLKRFRMMAVIFYVAMVISIIAFYM